MRSLKGSSNPKLGKKLFGPRDMRHSDIHHIPNNVGALMYRLYRFRAAIAT